MESNMELTILIPALNEEKTIGIVIEKANKFIETSKIEAEILIVNNGSTDNTKKIAKEKGTRVIDVIKKGYGIALRRGIECSRGKFIIMGDADDSYNFLELEEFMENLRQGYDIVIGNRYGKKMQKGSMKILHKYIGTPLLSYIIRKKFKVSIKDINCGLRGVRKESVEKLNFTTEGMEFASEMIIRASNAHLKIKEIGINFYRDKRGTRSNLNTIRDGIRHLKLINSINS